MPKWSKQPLDAAVRVVATLKGKTSVNSIVKKYDIPVSKVHDHVKGKVKKVRDTQKKRKCARSCRKWDLD